MPETKKSENMSVNDKLDFQRVNHVPVNVDTNGNSKTWVRVSSDRGRDTVHSNK